MPTNLIHATPRDGRERAMSLVELLLVLAIIGLLMGLLLPSLSYAQAQMGRLVCRNNLGQWGKATWYFRNENNELLPSEGTYFNIQEDGTWFNELPPYLDLPPYRDFERLGEEAIRRRPDIDTWICPAKNRSAMRTSQSGLNQFHYGLNQVLDGLGGGNGSADTPGFPDLPDSVPLSALAFAREPRTVWMFDILPNSPAGTPRDAINRHQKSQDGRSLGEFHGDFTNVLFLDGSTSHCRAEDLVEQRDFQNGAIHWRHPRLYWGYRPAVP
ncbi:MAG: prepilin-type N-terminal cleavage/methylation domain-containing protein [Phycisphaerae bacterium]